MKALENPISRIYIKETSNGYEVRMEFAIDNEHVNSGYPDYQRKIASVVIANYIRKKADADKLHEQLCELFGITIKIQKSKIKPITFAELVVEE